MKVKHEINPEIFDKLRESDKKRREEMAEYVKLREVDLHRRFDTDQDARHDLAAHLTNESRNDNMWAKYGEQWIENCKANRQSIYKAIRRPPTSRFVHHSHIIACSGPGLDGALEDLRRIGREKTANIWAVDCSWRPLKKAGVRIAGMVSVDFDDEQITKMITAFQSTLPPPAIFAAHSAPTAVRMWHGPKYFTCIEGMEDKLGEHVKEVHCLPKTRGFGTVSGTALWFARQIGGGTTRQIAFVGNDLSYPEVGGTKDSVGTVHRYCRYTTKANRIDGTSILDPAQEMEGGEGSVERFAISAIDPGTKESVGTRYVWRSKLMDFYGRKFMEFFKLEKEVAKKEGRLHPVRYWNCTPSILDLYSFTSQDQYAKTDLISAPLKVFEETAKRMGDIKEKKMYEDY